MQQCLFMVLALNTCGQREWKERRKMINLRAVEFGFYRPDDKNSRSANLNRLGCRKEFVYQVLWTGILIKQFNQSS